MENKSSLAALIGVVIVAIAGVAYYTQNDSVAPAATGGTPVAGNTFNTAKVAAINFAPRSLSATSTSLTNTDANDRIIIDAFASCQGLGNMFGLTGSGVSDFRFSMATSSSATLPAPSGLGATFAAANFAVGTSTAEGYTATTTYTSPYARRWNSGSSLIINANATSSSAMCNVGVHYLAT